MSEMRKNVYRLIAYKGGEKQILAEYRGDDTGLYNFQIERREERREYSDKGCKPEP